MKMSCVAWKLLKPKIDVAGITTELARVQKHENAIGSTEKIPDRLNSASIRGEGCVWTFLALKGALKVTSDFPTEAASDGATLIRVLW